jgi:hypothetical protein
MRQINEALPSFIGEDNSALVENILAARTGKPISENFDRSKALRDIFGRRPPKLAPDCLRTTTPVGDPSEDPCTAESGEAAGRGEYKELSWSKRLAFGDLKYNFRPAEVAGLPDPVKMTDEDAYAKAMVFLTETLGVPKDEIPMVPEEVDLPVRTLAIGEMTGEGGKEATQRIIPIAKMVQIPRGLPLGSPIKDPDTGRELPIMPAQGEAYVLMNDAGILQASVRNWVEMAPSPRIEPRNAKTRNELVAEIADAIMNSSDSPIGMLGVRFEIMAGDLMRSGDGSVKYAMLPAVQISHSPMSRDSTEEEQAKFAGTAGQGLEFSLVHLKEEVEAEAELPTTDD